MAVINVLRLENGTGSGGEYDIDITSNQDTTYNMNITSQITGKVNPSDADAIAGDVLDGKTFYAGNTTKKTGTIQTYSGSTTITNNGTIATSGKYLASDLTINIPNKLAQYIDGSLTTITANDLSGATNVKEWGFTRTNATSIELPNTVTVINDYAFYMASALTTITFPSSLTSIGNQAFSQCTSLTGDIVIPDTVTTMGTQAFTQCSNISSIRFPSNSTFYAIPDSTCYNCTSLTNFVMPDTMSTVGKYVFSGCTSLTHITLSPITANIKQNAFYNCTGLISITINRSTVPSLSSNTLTGCSNLAAIYVPASAVSTYQGATNWTAYSSIIQALNSMVINYTFGQDIPVSNPNYIPVTLTATFSNGDGSTDITSTLDSTTVAGNSSTYINWSDLFYLLGNESYDTSTGTITITATHSSGLTSTATQYVDFTSNLSLE